MRRFRDLRIKGKLSVVIMATTTAGVVLAGVGFIAVSVLVERQRMVRNLRTSADVLGGSCQAALMFAIRQDAENVLRSLNMRPSIRLARIRDETGAPFASYGNTEEAAAAEAAANRGGGTAFTRAGLCVHRAIRFENRTIGSILIVDDLREVRDTAARQAAILLMAVAVSLGVAYILTSRLRNVVARPILDLAAAAQRVSRSRDYTLRVRREGNDEIGDLVTSLNHMLGEIETRDREVTEARRRAELRANEAETAHRELEREMAERKRAEANERELQQRLADAQRIEALGLLAGGVAHDLNNILGPLVALPELIQADIERVPMPDAGMKDRIVQDMRTIGSAATRAASVIRDLLTLSRRGSYPRVPLDLNAVVGECVRTTEFRALCEKYPAATVDVELATHPVTVNGSDTHLSRAVANVIRNAVEATTAGGRVSVSTGTISLAEPRQGREVIPAGEYGRVTVADTGAGIASQDMQRIFEPFFTRKKATERSGSGLGLAIVHGIVKDHQGFVEVRSAPARGTTFEMYLPLVATPVAGDPQPATSPTGTERILVVDDEPTQRFLAQRTLERLGYVVVTAAHGSEAVDLCRGASAAFDLVMLDMIMEDGFDGLDTFQSLRRIRPDQKALITSGYAPTERGRRAMEMGAHWIAKPYAPAALAQAVRSALGPPQPPAEGANGRRV